MSSSRGSEARRRGGSSAHNESLQEQHEAASAATVRHLKASLTLTTEAEEMGTETLSSLHRQGESLERSQAKVDAIEAHNNKSRHILSGMGSLWGTFTNSFFKRAPAEAEEVVAKKAAERKAADAAAATAAAGGGSGGGSGAGVGKHGGSASASRGAGSGSLAPTGGSVEEDELLAAISRNMGRLGEVGREMNAELTRQDRAIDELTSSTDRAGISLRKNTGAAKKLT